MTPGDAAPPDVCPRDRHARQVTSAVTSVGGDARCRAHLPTVFRKLVARRRLGGSGSMVGIPVAEVVVDHMEHDMRRSRDGCTDRFCGRTGHGAAQWGARHRSATRGSCRWAQWVGRQSGGSDGRVVGRTAGRSDGRQGGATDGRAVGRTAGQWGGRQGTAGQWDGRQGEHREEEMSYLRLADQVYVRRTRR